MTVEDQRVEHNGMGDTVGHCLGVFYAGYGTVRSCDLEWIQNAMKVLVGLFIRHVLADNVAKSRTMTCQPRSLRAEISDEAMSIK